MTPRKCLDCKSAALPHKSRCDRCYRALLTRLFGRSAEYPVRAA